MATPRKGPKASPPAASTDDTSDDARPRGDLVEIVRGLAAAVAEHGLSELVVDTPNATFTLRRGAVASVAMPAMPAMTAPPAMIAPVMPAMPMPMPMLHGGLAHAAQSEQPAAPEEKGHVVTSPFVGTFYRRPNPDSPEYVRQGDKVRKGQVLCIVEAMKLMNEIEADLDGTVVAILAEDQSPVEYGQHLFRIAP